MANIRTLRSEIEVFFNNVKLDDFESQEKFNTIKRYCLQGTPSTLWSKAEALRKKLHDFLAKYIQHMFGFQYEGDIDPKLQSQGALKMDRMFNVKSPCCAPVTSEGDVMEKGMKTIREAIVDAIEMLENRKVTLYDTYHMLRSLPLLCYLFELEKQNDYIETGNRVLFPVSKEAFFKEGLMESSIIGLLQYINTGRTEYYLDYSRINEEAALISQYESCLPNLTKAQRTVTIYRIFQQTRHFSSVFFVPSGKLTSHYAMQGLMSNQFSDFKNHMPTKYFPLPKNEVFEGLRSRKQSQTLEQKCSELACFLFRVCETEDIAKEIFEKVKIDGKWTVQIVKGSKNHRECAYAHGLLGTAARVVKDEPYELIWLVSQKKGYGNWSGTFIAYMNVGTVDEPRGIFFSGYDEFLDEVRLTCPYSEYPDLKNHLIRFYAKMHWKGGIEKHLKLTEEPEKDVYTLKLIKYAKRSFQVRIRENQVGLKVIFLREGIGQPVIKYSGLEYSGVKCNVKLRGENFPGRLLNQGLTEHFKIDTEAYVGIFKLHQLWNKLWMCVKNNFKLSIDHMIVTCSPGLVYLEPKPTSKLQKLGFKVRSLASSVLTSDMIKTVIPMEGVKTQEWFTPGHDWSVIQFCFFLSIALYCRSTYTAWVSLKGYLQGLTRGFVLLTRERIKDILLTDNPGFLKGHMVEMIQSTAKQPLFPEADLTKPSWPKSVDINFNNLDEESFFEPVPSRPLTIPELRERMRLEEEAKRLAEPEEETHVINVEPDVPLIQISESSSDSDVDNKEEAEQEGFPDYDSCDEF